MVKLGVRRRAQRALERQLEFQRRKARNLHGSEQAVMAGMERHSREVREKLVQVAPIPEEARVLEVGCGSHGLIFFFEAADKVGVDPLAEEYRTLFPVWQHQSKTIAAFGEALPFEDRSFDVVLCDNVVDHAEDPRRIVEEIARVLRPGGLLYFTVNVHHPVYHLAASIHAAWRALGLPFEITPFADHTVHLTPGAARALFDGLPLRVRRESDNVGEVKRGGPGRIRHFGDWLKYLFFKNARVEIIAERQPAA